MFPFKHLKRALPVVALLTTAAFFTTPASAQVNPGGEKGGGSHGLTFNGKGQNGAGDTHGLNFTNSGKTDVPGQKNGEPIYMSKGKDGAGDTHRLNVNTGKIDPPNPDIAGKGKNGAGDAEALEAYTPAVGQRGSADQKTNTGNGHDAGSAKSTKIHPDLMRTGQGS